jgi:hypothetical protein
VGNQDSKSLAHQLAGILGKQYETQTDEKAWQTKITEVTKEVRKKIASILDEASGTLNTEILGDVSVEADTPDAYVIGLRIPRMPESNLYYPSRLFYIIIPCWFPQTEEVSLQIARVLAIGGNQGVSLRNFLRSWIDSDIGGCVIYEGNYDIERIEEEVAKDLVFVIEESRNISVNKYDQRILKMNKVLLWPINSRFQLGLCSSCLLPKGCGTRCNACSKHRISAWK